MKKMLFIALNVAILLNISANPLKIAGKSNKLVKYGQCWIFSGVTSKSSAGENGINEVIGTQTNDNKNGLYSIVLGVNNTKKDPVNPELAGLIASGDLQATATITIKDCNGKTTIAEAKAVYNAKTDQIEFKYETKQPTTKCEMYVEDVKFNVVNKCNQTFEFKANREWKKAENDFQSKVNLVDDPCEKNVKIESFTITGTSLKTEKGNIVIQNNGGLTLKLAGPPTLTKFGASKVLLSAVDCKGNKKAITVDLAFNSKTGFYEANLSIPADKTCNWTMEVTSLEFTNLCGETTTFQTKGIGITAGPSGTTDETIATYDFKRANDPCDVKYVSKGIDASIEDKNGFLNMYFFMDLEKRSDTPSAINVIVEITNCKGEIKYVQVAMKYSTKTGMWGGAESLTQDKECPWNVTNFTIYATSPCGEKTHWDTDYNPEKQKASKRAYGDGRVFWHWSFPVTTTNP